MFELFYSIEFINIIALLLSPLIASLITIVITNKLEKRKDKIEIFKKLMTFRALPESIEYVKILNSIEVIFYDSKKVSEAWDELYKEYKKLDSNIEEIRTKKTRLIQSIAEDLGYTKNNLDKDLEREYIPLWLVNNYSKKEEKQKIEEYINDKEV